MLNVDPRIVAKLVQEYMQGDQLVAQLAIREKNNIEVMIMNFVKQVFFVDAEVSRVDEEGRQLEKYRSALASIRDRMVGKAQIPRKELQEITVLDNSFVQYRK